METSRKYTKHNRPEELDDRDFEQDVLRLSLQPVDEDVTDGLGVRTQAGQQRHWQYRGDS
jgi:hypothetical protein